MINLYRHYPTSEYQHLFDNTKRIIQEGPDDSNHAGNKRRRGDDRSVSEVTLSAASIRAVAAMMRDQDAMSALTTDQTAGGPEANAPNLPPTGGNAGAAFEREAHEGGGGRPLP